ncbi:MAG: SDR family oxidoreductase, partial [Pseudomonadota bacterium]
LAADILVNNAGVSTHQMISGHSDADWDHVINVNLSGAYRMIRRALPGMLGRRWGRIVNIASTAARTAVADSAAYCASKAGLLGLSRAVALEGAPHGVTCMTVSPTWVETEMLRRSATDLTVSSGSTQADEIARIASSNPQSRLVQPEEVARLVGFLCSDAAPALTMEDIQVNAGAWW